MKEWEQFAKTSQTAAESSGERPNPWHYMLVKATDSGLSISVFVLTLIFAYVGLFALSPESEDLIRWTLNATNLCLGVFLGLLRK